MTETAMNYGRVLCDLKLPEGEILQAEEILQAVPELKKVLESPAVKQEQKEKAIDRIFPNGIRNFLKVVCRHQEAALLGEIFEAYRDVYCREHHILRARLTYVTAPDERQQAGITELLKRRYQAETVELNMEQDNSLMGGFVIRAAGQETDCSLKGRLARLEEKLTRR